MFVLVTFFAEATTCKAITPFKITIGQFIGFTVIVVVSMIGFGVSLVLPAEPIGFLGLLPILLGIWKLFELFPGADEDTSAEMSTLSGMKSVFKVASITVMNGGDNIGTYIPLFSQAKGAEIAVYVVTYYILLGLWCLTAFLVMKQRHILQIAQKYASVVVPILYMGLGVYIVVKSSCYPWSIERIDDSAHTGAGRTIMAVVTTFLLLVCIGIMLWLKLRPNSAPVVPNNPDSDRVTVEPNSPNLSPGSTESLQSSLGNRSSAPHEERTAQSGSG